MRGFAVKDSSSNKLSKTFMYRFLLVILIYPVFSSSAQYSGTGSVTQGLASLLQSNIYTCAGGRVANTGGITATDNSVWVVPAQTRFSDSTAPWASDLYNGCNGNLYANTAAALSALDPLNIVEIDSAGQLITAYVFADNYFELYVNGISVGKDRVPYTPFNSSIIQFRVNLPFTIAMHLVDWEEHLGLGAELSGGFNYHDGDGGVVAVFKNSSNEIVAKTDSTWKAQTFYTSPIQDLSCPSEIGSLRLSNNCSTADVQDGSSFYALHWQIPSDCFEKGFNDSSWPQASLYSNSIVGVNNKPAYENFIDIFDHSSSDADFIWSTNLILDNEVIVRKEVSAVAAMNEKAGNPNNFKLYPNPAHSTAILNIENKDKSESEAELLLFNLQGETILNAINVSKSISLPELKPGVYFVKITSQIHTEIYKLIIQ